MIAHPFLFSLFTGSAAVTISRELELLDVEVGWESAKAALYVVVAIRSILWSVIGR